MGNSAAFVAATGRHFIVCQNSVSDSSTSTRPKVLVVGASGKIGRRVVRELVSHGCSVRAGGRSEGKFDQVSNEENWLQDNVERVNLDIAEDSQDDLVKALGDATTVVCATGNAKSFGKVDGFGIAKLCRAAGAAKHVDQMVLVSSIGVGRPWVFPTTLFNLIGGLLIFKDYSEHVLRNVSRKTGLKYTIVRPGGFERPTDDHYLTHNIVLYPRNSLSIGTISASQIAQFIATAVMNVDVSSGKTVELVAEDDAPKVDLITQLKKITSK